MKSKFLFGLTLGMLPIVASGALPFVGTYQTIDDETNSPKSIVQPGHRHMDTSYS